MSSVDQAARDAAIRRNLHHLYTHQSQPNPKPIPHTTITRGFEAVAFPKIVRELQDKDLIVKQMSLLAARELLGSPMGYMQCLAAGITPAVVNLLQDDDEVVRERAAGTLEYIAVKEVGARDIIQHEGVDSLVKRLQDPSTKVRDAAYRALVEAARFDPMRKALVDAPGALVQLMGLVLEEEQGRSLQALVLLNLVVQVRGNSEALELLVDDASAIPSLAQLIEPGQPDAIQEQAAQLLGLLTSTLVDAKMAAVTSDCVRRLLELLAKPNVTLACAAATALMSITIIREGKYAALEWEGWVETLKRWLDLGHEKLCINIMECISNIAEAPEARPQLVKGGVVERLNAIFDRKDASAHAKRSAAQALRQCGFQHRPFEPLPGQSVAFSEEEQPPPAETWKPPTEPIGVDSAPGEPM